MVGNNTKYIFGKSYFSIMQIAQVHRATLSDGQEVVVKVQHEGIKTIILEVIHSGALVFSAVGCKQ